MEKRNLWIIALVAIITVGIIACKEDEPDPQPQPVEKTYLAPNTKVTIKYMGLASDTSIPAEISKLVKVFTASPVMYSTWDKTIYVIDGSSSGPEIQNNGTMKIGRKYVINTAQDDVDDAIYDLRNSWTA